MADTQEDDLPQATALNSADFLRIVADLAGTPVSKVISRANFAAYTDTLYEPIGGGSTGWQDVSETWTRTGNHTFTVSTDLTTKYGPGTLIRCHDSGGGAYKQGVIGSSSYGSPNTTITLITNTSFLLAAGAITDTQISYQQNPQGWAGWFNWDPAPTGFSAVPTTQTYRWTTHGRMITLAYNEGTNGTSNLTTFTAAAPVIAATAVTNGSWTAVMGAAVDNSVLLTTPGRCFIIAGSSTITLRKDTANAAWTGSGGKRAIFTLTYEF